MIRCFLDTNIIISGLLWKGNEEEILESSREGRIEIITSRYVLKEAESILAEKFKFAPGDILRMMEYIAEVCSEIVEVQVDEALEMAGKVSDKNDAPILAATIKSGSVLITGDKRLAEDAKRFVKVLSASELLRGLE